jgi:pimeloyl-ACP methyl ester carboxylesterase
MTTPKSIYYKTYGKNNGYAIVFLHGYLESSDIWEEFAESFAEEYFVVCIDIPGHGRSEILKGPASMEALADAVVSLTESLGMNYFNLAGHSMGGYLTMALLEKYPERINTAVLFHSTCYSDSEEKKINRDREAGLIKEGKKELIVNTNIPRLYSNDNLDSMKSFIERSKSIARKTPDEGVIYALEAMKSRPDRSEVLAKTDIPVLLLAGAKDNLIPLSLMEKMKSLSSRIRLVVLEESGHMGFFEQKDKAASELLKFFNENFECK